MTKSLNWTRKAFNRSIEFKGEKGEIIGTMTFKILDRDVEAELNGKKFRFDVYGFVNKEVAITDENNLEVGKIYLGFRNKAEAQLTNGEKYIWKRADFFMREWELIHDLPDTDNDPVIINYDRDRNFLNQEGKISILESSENSDLLTLVGFFIGFYFLRRRSAAAAVALGVAIS
ncbi:hypothetical protein [Emticicia sp. C21]|uniref:hypothetical protein n=1 Tax=Emticicia sp. C21 TaxID=2302915 RepID=UPI000E343E94|nr:hypothetical protein [Emticicia sp. C21]RFS14878.1 hypothetical protein D0T08_19695 [Emticicia sp. C21]